MDGEIVSIGRGVGAGVNQGLVEVQKDGFFLGERGGRKPRRRRDCRRRREEGFGRGRAKAAESQLVGARGGAAEDCETGKNLGEAAAAGTDGASDGGLDRRRRGARGTPLASRGVVPDGAPVAAGGGPG